MKIEQYASKIHNFVVNLSDDSNLGSLEPEQRFGFAYRFDTYRLFLFEGANGSGPRITIDVLVTPTALNFQQLLWTAEYHKDNCTGLSSDVEYNSHGGGVNNLYFSLYESLATITLSQFRRVLNHMRETAREFNRAHNDLSTGSVAWPTIGKDECYGPAEDDSREHLSSQHDVVHETQNRPTEEILAELHALVGLEDVKKEIRQIVAAQRVAVKRQEFSLRGEHLSPHLVFVGNPGTGKTTVARLLGELYHSIGLLKRGHVIETERSGLVGAFIGTTALKTRRMCHLALDGVLFIDEAYTLVREENEKDFGPEAVATLLTFMENNRGRFALVIAGYPEEMARLLRSNPGLRSRFDNTILFDDYDDKELEEIFLDMVAKNDYELSPEAYVAVSHYIKALPIPRPHSFANGREMRRLLNEIVKNQAEYVMKNFDLSTVTEENLRMIPGESVPPPLIHKANKRKDSGRGSF